MIEQILSPTQQGLIEQIREQKLFKEPLVRGRVMLLKQLKDVNKQIKKFDRTIIMLAGQLDKIKGE